MGCLIAEMGLLRDNVSASLSQVCSFDSHMDLSSILFASDGVLIDCNGEAIYTTING